MRKFITKSDLQLLLREGKTQIEIPPQVKITQEAEEFAKFAGIKFIIQKISRKKYLLGNWKMAPSISEAFSWLKNWDFSESSLDFVGVAPPFTHLFLFFPYLKNRKFLLGAQNFYPATRGAFTGEISTDFLRDLGVSFLLVGHSERRHILKEAPNFIEEKLKWAYDKFHGKIVYCIGETYQEKKNSQTFSVLKNQLKPLSEFPQISERIIIAYEPVWSIGTGLVGDNYEIDRLLSFLRTEINALSQEVGAGDKISLLYGGSVKSSNIERLSQLKEVDGFLVGGASLKAQDFKTIEKIFAENKKNDCI
jgi:triosephosphate isomerase